jgi:hypothetical protein
VKGDETLPPLNFTEQAALNLRLNAGFLLGLVREQVVQLLFEVIDADFGFSDRQQLVEPVQPFVLPLASNSRRRSDTRLRSSSIDAPAVSPVSRMYSSCSWRFWPLNSWAVMAAFAASA